MTPDRRLLPERLDERVDPLFVEEQHAFLVKPAREVGRSPPVFPVDRLVHPPRIVEQPEAEDQGPIDGVAPRARRELEARRRHAMPVGLTVPCRLPPPGAREDDIHERPQRPRFHARTIARCADVCGDGAGAAEAARLSSAIRRIGSPSSSPCRISQHPTTVPVRPTPPQQWTYTVAPPSISSSMSSRIRGHVRDRRRSEVDDRVRDPAYAGIQETGIRLERVGGMREVDECGGARPDERADPAPGLVGLGGTNPG